MMNKLQERYARIIAIMNNKGICKTSSATNLAVHYARSGKRTLLIDSPAGQYDGGSHRKW